jgi:phosphotriesterase-related protein
MGQINTVTGPIDSSQLGFTLMHEHVMVSASGLYDSYPDLLGQDREDAQLQTSRMRKRKALIQL